MGASTSWIAVKGKSRAKVLQQLGLEIGESAGAKVQGSQFAGGWYVVAAAGYGNPITNESVLKQLSSGCEVVEGGVDTRVMHSIASGWARGRNLWRVHYNSDRALQDVERTGQLPPEFSSIYETLRSQQNADKDDVVNYMFDVPVKLCQTLTGYHYSESIPEEKWHLLFPSSKKSLFGKLFGP